MTEFRPHGGVEAVRRGDYPDAVGWLDTLAAVDDRFSLTADEIVARWSERAGEHRRGLYPEDGADDAGTSDYRGLFGALLMRSYDGIVLLLTIVATSPSARPPRRSSASSPSATR